MIFSQMRFLVVGGVLLLAGCATDNAEVNVRKAIESQSEFTLDSLSSKSIAKSYIFCPYMGESVAKSLGFDEKEFPNINKDSSAWETGSGIGLVFQDGSQTHVEWFDRSKINACPNPSGKGYVEVPHDKAIGIEDVEEDIASEKKIVKTLRF